MPNPQRPPTKEPDFLFRGLVSAKQQEISDTLVDPSHLPRLHLFITRTEVTARRRDGDIEVTQFGIWEKIPLGVLSLPSAYKGETRRNVTTPSLIILEGWVPPLVRFYVRFQIRAVSTTQCEVREEIWIEAPWLLRPLLKRLVNKGHSGLLSRLASLFPLPDSKDF